MMAINVSHIVDEPVKKRVSEIVMAMLGYIKGVQGPLVRTYEQTLITKFGPAGLTGFWGSQGMNRDTGHLQDTGLRCCRHWCRHEAKITFYHFPYHSLSGAPDARAAHSLQRSSPRNCPHKCAVPVDRHLICRVGVYICMISSVCDPSSTPARAHSPST